MTGSILKNTNSIKVGDVLLVSKQLTDKTTGQPYWWKTFRVVVSVMPVRRGGDGCFADLLILKMHPDLDKDLRTIDFTEEGLVVQELPEDQHPQGVIAMRMKMIHKGIVKLE